MIKVVARYQHGLLNHKWDILAVPAILSIAIILTLIHSLFKFENIGSGIPVSDF